MSAAIVHPEERIEPVTRVAEPAAKSARRFPVDFGGHRAVAGALAAAVAIVAVMAFSAAVMVPGPGSPQRASPGPVLGVANPTGSADADSTPQRIGAPESSGSATLPPTGGTGPGRLETTAERLSVWEDKFGEVRVQVIVTARNAGGAPLVVATSAASWSILDEAGDVTARGRFTHAFPGVVAPGGEVYFIDGVSAAFAQPADLAELNVLIPSEAMVDDGTIVRLETSEVSWMAGDDGGLEVSGEVSNASTETVTGATVGIVLKDDRDRVLAGAYSVNVGDLAPGETLPFVTAYPGTPQIDPAVVASAAAAASGAAAVVARR